MTGPLKIRFPLTLVLRTDLKSIFRHESQATGNGFVIDCFFWSGGVSSDVCVSSPLPVRFSSKFGGSELDVGVGEIYEE